MRVQQREHTIDGSELSVRALKHFTDQGCIEVEKKRLSITSTPSRRQDSNVTDDVSIATVEVSGIPVATSEEYLRMYFESEKRSGGGELVHLQYSVTEGTATVTFKDHRGIR